MGGISWRGSRGWGQSSNLRLGRAVQPSTLMPMGSRDLSWWIHQNSHSLWNLVVDSLVLSCFMNSRTWIFTLFSEWDGKLKCLAAEVSWLFLISRRCSYSLSLIDRLVSPTYPWSHFEHVMYYTRLYLGSLIGPGSDFASAYTGVVDVRTILAIFSGAGIVVQNWTLVGFSWG